MTTKQQHQLIQKFHKISRIKLFSRKKLTHVHILPSVLTAKYRQASLTIHKVKRQTANNHCTTVHHFSKLIYLSFVYQQQQLTLSECARVNLYHLRIKLYDPLVN